MPSCMPTSVLDTVRRGSPFTSGCVVTFVGTVLTSGIDGSVGVRMSVLGSIVAVVEGPA